MYDRLSSPLCLYNTNKLTMVWGQFDNIRNWATISEINISRAKLPPKLNGVTGNVLDQIEESQEGLDGQRAH